MKKNAKCVVAEVLEVDVYDEDGKFIVKLDSLTETSIFIDEDGHGRLIVKDALLNIDFLKFIYGDKNNSQNDFEEFISHITDKKITFNKKALKSCKLIAKTVLYDPFTNEIAHRVFYEIPKAEIVSPFVYETGVSGITAFDTLFNILEFNDKGDLFNMHFA